MTEYNQQGYRTYLQNQKGLSDNTISSYCSGLNHLSSHCGQDLFALTDVQQLNALLARYIQGGADEEQGKYGNWAASNALRHWRDYVVSLEAGYEAVLAHFASVPELAKQLNEHGQTALFYALAEGLHQCNADWWILGSGEIRAGRSEHPLMWENAVVLKLRLTGDGVQIRLKIDEQAQWQPLTEAALAEMLTEIAGHPRLKAITHRQPYWPDDYPAPNTVLWIPLRESALQQGVLHIPKLQGVFPPESIGNSGQGALKPFTLILPDGSQLLTEVASTSDLGRIKHNFAELFAAGGLAEFDRAVIQPISANIYSLHFEKAGALSSGKTSQSQAPMKQELTPASLPKNQILFGPPGTGKTYHTINETLAILDPDFLAANKQLQQRAELKKRFDELVNEGRVRFVTFHQSFSYEDFVEGLRASKDINDELIYVVESGVFKELCLLAKKKNQDELLNCSDVKKASALLNPELWVFRYGAFGAFKSEIEESIDEGFISYEIYHDDRKFSIKDQKINLSKDDLEQLLIGCGLSTVVGKKILSIPTGSILALCDGVKQVLAFGEVGNIYETKVSTTGQFLNIYRSVKWIHKFEPPEDAKLFFKGSLADATTTYKITKDRFTEFTEKIVEAAAKGAKNIVSDFDSLSTQKNNYVLIVDEINRGNISRIFGELITLIEPSKREGADEALSVILPYSKQSFSVPDNVYIIGTMNTTDRSLAGLDVALRRRFTFKEMPPKPELLDGVLVQGIDIGAMLRVMNQRIAVLLDRDHCLGHAYFMPLAAEGGNTLTKLAEIFEQNIIPLLQEYFFEDWERIRWVLNDQNKAAGDAFIVEDADLRVSELFAGVQDKLRQTDRWRINRAAFQRIAAYRKIGGAQPTLDELEQA